MNLYLSGPMTGMKDFNRPAMLAEEEKLIRDGFGVINPARLPEGKMWEWYMCKAVNAVPRCDGLAQMPGWNTSFGCLIEFAIARKFRLIVQTTSAFIDARKREMVWNHDIRNIPG